MINISSPGGGKARLAGSGLVLLVLLVGLLFPFAAVLHAGTTIAAPLPSDAGTPASSARSSQSNAGTTEGLGVRSLPLLSDAAFAAWQEDHARAIDAVSASVLPGEGAAYAEVSRFARGTVWNTDEVSGKSGDDNVDFGVSSEIAHRALAADPREEDVLTLIGYLLLAKADTSVDSNTPVPVFNSADWLALALAQEAAAHYGDCDSKLAYAHTMSLVSLPSREWVDGLFDAASERCGADMTPRVEKAYYDLGFIARGEGPDKCFIRATAVTARSWSRVLSQFKEIQALSPRNPAGYFGEADTYRIAAEILSQWHVQPFTTQAFHRAAIQAYQAAQMKSPAPEITVSLARAQLDSANGVEADRLLDSLPERLASRPEIITLRAQTQASQGRFSEAAQLSHVAAQAPPDSGSATRGLTPENTAFDVRSLTGGLDTAYLSIFNEGCGGNSLAEDHNFVPSQRLPHGGQYDYAILAGDWGVGDSDCDFEPACEILRAHGQAASLTDEANDYYQDLLRSVGDVDHAAGVTEGWVRSQPESPLAHERLGETRYLQSRWEESASESAAAARLYTGSSVANEAIWPMTGPHWAQLREAAAGREAGRVGTAKDLLESLLQLLSVDADEDRDDPTLPMYAEQELGLIEFDQGNYDSAIQHMSRSIEFGRAAEEGEIDAGSGPKVLTGVQAQTASAASLKLGHFEQARAFAQQAYDIDPYSPLFREALAESERNLDKGAAIDSYRAALDRDATLFSTWNNLGVLLYEQGDRQAAESAFERALQVKPDYATGWFNLGVVESESAGVGHFFRAQGAFGRAIAIDRTFGNRDRVVSFDEEVYDSGLDLSRPIPPGWQLTDTSRTRPTLIGLGVLLVVLVRIVWILSSDWLVGRGIVLAISAQGRKHKLLQRVVVTRPSALWTSCVSLAALLLLSGASGRGEMLFAVVLFSALLGAHALAPRLMAPGQVVRQTSFLPASLLTPVLAFFGLGFAPPAPMDTTSGGIATGIKRSGLAILAVLTVVFGVTAWLTGVPVARSAAVAALVLATSALVPVSPLDGAELSLRRSSEIAVTIVIGAATLLVASGAI